MYKRSFFIAILLQLFCMIGHSQRVVVVSIDSLIISSDFNEGFNDYCGLQEDSLANHLEYLIDSFQLKYIQCAQLAQRCYPPSPVYLDSVFQNLKKFEQFILNEENRTVRKGDFLHLCSQKVIASQVGQILAEEDIFDEVKIAIADMPIYTDPNRPSPFITERLVPFINERKAQVLMDWAVCKEEANQIQAKPAPIFFEFAKRNRL